MEEFIRGARSLRKATRFIYLRHPSLRDTDPGTLLEGEGVRPRFGRLDALNQLAAGRTIARQLQQARQSWVVATAASYGSAAAASGRPYGCWIGTGLAQEVRSREPYLPLSRRLASRGNMPILARIERRVLREAAVVYATSETSRRGIAEVTGTPISEIRILPIPVDLEALTPEPVDRWADRLSAPTLVFAGRGSDPRKNLPLLLRAFVTIRRELPNARLRLVGTPPSVSLPEGVDALGHVPSVGGVLRDASLFILPSRQEGFGIVVAEALACGVPVITTPSGGPVELVERSGGGLVLDDFSAEGLAEAAIGALRNANWLIETRIKGRTFVEREHSRARFGERLADAFRDLEDAG